MTGLAIYLKDLEDAFLQIVRENVNMHMDQQPNLQKDQNKRHDIRPKIF